MSNNVFLIVWVSVTSQREAVQLCPQFSALSPLVWESWIKVTTTCRIQEWSYCLLDWKVHNGDWRLWGQIPSACTWCWFTQRLSPNVWTSPFFSAAWKNAAVSFIWMGALWQQSGGNNTKNVCWNVTLWTYFYCLPQDCYAEIQNSCKVLSENHKPLWSVLVSGKPSNSKICYSIQLPGSYFMSYLYLKQHATTNTTSCAISMQDCCHAVHAEHPQSMLANALGLLGIHIESEKWAACKHILSIQSTLTPTFVQHLCPLR